MFKQPCKLSVPKSMLMGRTQVFYKRLYCPYVSRLKVPPYLTVNLPKAVTYLMFILGPSCIIVPVIIQAV